MKARWRSRRTCNDPRTSSRVLEFNFRPGNPEVPIAAPITADNGVDPDQPQTLLHVPAPPVMVGLLDRWAEQRKGARVLLVIDVSGSMKDARRIRRPRDQARSRQAGRRSQSLADFRARTTWSGLRVFTTGIGDSAT